MGAGNPTTTSVDYTSNNRSISSHSDFKSSSRKPRIKTFQRIRFAETEKRMGADNPLIRFLSDNDIRCHSYFSKMKPAPRRTLTLERRPHLLQVLFGVGDDEDFDDLRHRHLAAPKMEAYLAAFRGRHISDGVGRHLNFVVQPAQ